jgi:hypothetical protein
LILQKSVFAYFPDRSGIFLDIMHEWAIAARSVTNFKKARNRLEARRFSEGFTRPSGAGKLQIRY